MDTDAFKRMPDPFTVARHLLPNGGSFTADQIDAAEEILAAADLVVAGRMPLPQFARMGRLLPRHGTEAAGYSRYVARAYAANARDPRAAALDRCLDMLAPRDR